MIAMVSWRGFSGIFRKLRGRSGEAGIGHRDHEALRFQGHAGGRIATHRALIRVPVLRLQLWLSAALALGLALAWFAGQGGIVAAWTAVLEIGRGALGLPGAIGQAETSLAGGYVFRIPYPHLTASIPSALTWWLTLGGVILLWVQSVRIDRCYLPLVYLLRVGLFIQLCALIFFGIWPAAFPYALSDYLYGMLLAGYVLIGVVPLVFGLVYYVFDFGYGKKLALTVLAMSHLAVFVPLQYLVQAYVVHHLSLLFLPVMFFLFGLPLDVLIVIALYGWGMSWRPRSARRDADLPSRQA